jgi:hypothetical protein
MEHLERLPEDAVGISDSLILEISHGTPTSIQELVVNYLRAVERFRAQDARSSVLEEQLRSESLAKAALAEALSWADTLDQRLAQWPKGAGRPTKKERKARQRKPWARDLSQEAHNLVEAFQHARNVVHHRWFDLISVRMSSDGDAQVNLWVWAPLPNQDGRGDGRTAELDALYSTELEGRPLLDTLDELAAAFWQMRGHEIERAVVGQPGHDVLSAIKFDDE